jgi:hypothetical protein
MVSQNHIIMKSVILSLHQLLSTLDFTKCLVPFIFLILISNVKCYLLTGWGRGQSNPPPSNVQEPAPSNVQPPQAPQVQMQAQPQRQPPIQQAPMQQVPMQQQPPPVQQQQQPAPRPSSVQSAGSQGSGGADYKPRFPAKMGIGTKGIRMVVDTNHLKMDVQNKQMVIIHYDVDIKIVNRDGAHKDCPKKYLV